MAIKKSYSHSCPHNQNMACRDYIIPFSIASVNLAINFTAPFKSHYEVTNFLTHITRTDSVNTSHPSCFWRTRNGNLFCHWHFLHAEISPGWSHEKVVLLATHCLAYDGRYWDSSYQPEK
jgi:hypothetical protein